MQSVASPGRNVKVQFERQADCLYVQLPGQEPSKSLKCFV